MALLFLILPTATLFFTFQGVYSENITIDVQPTYKVVQIGDPVVMLCRVNTQLMHCHIISPTNKNGYFISENNSDAPFKYEGRGLSKGDCGFRIDRANESHNGLFTCGLRFNTTSEAFYGKMTLVVAKTPTEVKMIVNNQEKTDQDNFQEGDTFVAKCSVQNGRPITNFTWYLGDVDVNDGLSEPVITKVDANQDLYSTEQNITRILQASDNDKNISCIADHPGLDAVGRLGYHTLNVKYPPKPADKFERFGLVEGSEGRISVVIEANPRPTFTWNVGRISIFEGESQNKFTVPKSNKQDSARWETVLIINKLTKEDVEQEYTIKATNELGTATYFVEISTSAEPIDGSIGAWTIVIIIIVIVLVFVLIGGVLFARSKGRWCFAGGDGQGGSLPEKGGAADPYLPVEGTENPAVNHHGSSDYIDSSPDLKKEKPKEDTPV
ncbi:fasciclin 3 isoform X2 [Lycorma delicatula]|uniref:fasciclin 3 isoform X2 n=1 Tax=Lycorma delicatula TaxID=130591 RepID=UPI003F51464D